ncbi:MAG TPA: DUF6271 family protein [Polyangiaceae bacterium]|nr:DUF6271 family protein [Polyangiaceae bacterium]
MHDHIFCVPTHRKIESQALEAYFLEVQFARRQCGVEMPLVIADDGTSNGEALARHARSFPDVECYYFTRQEVVGLYDVISSRLTAAERDAFRRVYPDGRVNYGNTFNKLYVLASVLGASTIHRRDSDTYAQATPAPPGHIFPIELELRHLGKETPRGPGLLVGGGYRGKWSIDIDHLVADEDKRDLWRFFNTLSIPDHEHAFVLEEHIHGNNVEYDGDRLEPGSIKEPDCGNLAMTRLFELLPCSPVPYALGSDYFTFACIIECNLGRVYHNRATVHAYTPCRYDNPDKLFNYWRATACLVIYQDFYRSYYRHLAPRASKLIGPTSSLAQVAELVTETLDEFERQFPATSERVLARLSDLYEVIGKQNEPALTEALLRVENDQLDLVRLIRESVKDHLQLIRAWKAVTASARLAADTHTAREILAAARLPRS